MTVGLIWVLLIIALVIAQLSQARTRTPLSGRPFADQRTQGRLQPASRQRHGGQTEVGQREQPGAPKPAVARTMAPERVAVAPTQPQSPLRRLPDMQEAVVWAEIIAPPVSVRRRRR